MIHITQEDMVASIASYADYYKVHVRKTLVALGEVIKLYFDKYADEDGVTIYFTDGIRIGCKVMPERERRCPKDQSAIIVKPTVKPFARFSDSFRQEIQENYEQRE